jgi:TonB family protein
MTQRRLPALIGASALILAAPGLAFAQGAAAGSGGAVLDAALAKPLTPAAVVLLLPSASQPKVVERLASALRDANPEVRAVAARLAFTTRHQALLPALTAALEAENEAIPGAEMVRALALIGGAASDDVVFRAMPRLAASATAAWLDVVARTRPTDVLQRPEALSDRAGAVLLGLAASHVDAVSQVFAQLASSPALEPAYLSMVARADRRSETMPWPVIAMGLKASPAVRRQVVSMLLRRQASGATLPAEAVTALADLRARISATDDPWLAVALELARRREPGTVAVPLGPAIAALDFSQAPGSWVSDGWLRRLTGDEEAALRARKPDLPARDVWGPEPGPAASSNAPTAGASAQTDMGVRMVHPLTPGLAAELGAMTGCPSAPDQVLAVQVAYRPTGQVREVFAPVGVGVERCGEAARLLAAIDVAIGSEPLSPTRTDLVLVGFRPEDAKCPRADRKGTREVRVGPDRIRAPRKVRNVPPVYPQSMQDQRIQGVVIIEANIGETGCISDATVLRSVHPTRDAAALTAVSLWRYEPTLLDGQPVPIIMTVTVNFSLH